jgi:tetratricopeptide (TPR) repeat protein
VTRPTRCPVLVERDEELRALSRLASETFEYGARTAALTGESGAGKSRLAQDFVASLPEAWTARTVRFTRTGASVPPLAPDRPLALVLDDAHFLDPSAIDDMARLLDELGSDAVLVLMTFRLGFHRAGSAEMRALARFVRDHRALELRVMPLSADGVAEMAAAMDRYAGEELFRRTGGNAFWAEELLRENERIPWTVVESITAQLEALPGDARELACALAVAEEPLSARAADALAADVDAAWSALIDAGLAETDGAGIWLRHALVGEAISSRLGPMESERWHGLLAVALEAEGADPDRVAHHWAAAGDSRRAAELATACAPRLREAGAIRRALTCYELALRHPPEDRRTAAELHEEGALTAARVGEYDAMARWLEEADRCYRAAGQPDRAVRMVLDPTFDYLPVRRSDRIRDEPVERLLLEARQAIRDDDPHAARELIYTAIAAAQSRRDGMALGRSARMLALTVGEFERADGLLDAALEYPDVAAHPGRQSRMLTIRASNLAAQGYTQVSLELIQRAVSITRRESEAVYRVGEIALANAMLLVGRVADAASLLRQAGEAMPGAAAVARTADGGQALRGGGPARTRCHRRGRRRTDRGSRFRSDRARRRRWTRTRDAGAGRGARRQGSRRAAHGRTGRCARARALQRRRRRPRVRPRPCGLGAE